MDSRERKHAYRQDRVRFVASMALLGVVVLAGITGADAKAEPLLAQMSPMRQDSINKMAPAPDLARTSIADTAGSPSGTAGQVPAQFVPPNGGMEAGYEPAGRRDPFAPIIQEVQMKIDENLPPLQRVALTDINLIAVMWGTYGYVAMVQTPEGNGYTVKPGTKIGQNSGVVSAVTERGIIVQERFTDVYGMKQEREHVKLLHPKEGSE